MSVDSFESLAAKLEQEDVEAAMSLNGIAPELEPATLDLQHSEPEDVNRAVMNEDGSVGSLVLATSHSQQREDDENCADTYEDEHVSGEAPSPCISLTPR